jgi:hypothetical protein
VKKSHPKELKAMFSPTFFDMSILLTDKVLYPVILQNDRKTRKEFDCAQDYVQNPPLAVWLAVSHKGGPDFTL